MMKLLGSTASPYVRKVRIVMSEKRIEAPLEIVDVWAPESKIADFNPLGKIPCLITDDGCAIYDSRVIAEYLDTLTPVHRLIPPGGRERIEVRTWEALADGLLDAAVALRVEQTRRTEAERSPAFVERQTGKIESALAAMSKGLEGRPWCTDGRYTLADIAVGCALGYLDFRLAQLDWRSRHPGLVAYADKLFSRPSFAETQPS